MLFFLGVVVGLLIPAVFCAAFIGYAEWTMRKADQCGDETCTEEHGDEDEREDMAIYDASLHYRNGQR